MKKQNEQHINAVLDIKVLQVEAIGPNQLLKWAMEKN
jgi:hypothetical protein